MISQYHKYYLSKYLDLIDTFIFVLTKKNSHVTFLHLYHHASVPLTGLIYMKVNPLIPGIYYFGIHNSFIHCLMYSYYAISSLGHWAKKYLWWKKYLTMLQIIQFLNYIVYLIILSIYNQGYPLFISIINYFQCFVFLCLFIYFYLNNFR